MLTVYVFSPTFLGVKLSSYTPEQFKNEPRQEIGHKDSDSVKSLANSSAPQVTAATKEGGTSTVHHKATAPPTESPDVEVRSEDSDVVIVKEDAGPLVPKDRVKAERERVRDRERESNSEVYKSHQENLSADQLRNLQLQQQLQIQQLYQAQLVQGGIPLEMGHLAYLQGIPFDPQAMAAAAQAQLLSPEQLQLLEQQRRMIMTSEQEVGQALGSYAVFPHSSADQTLRSPQSHNSPVYNFLILYLGSIYSTPVYKSRTVFRASVLL